jgi:hypothetical protein
MDPFNLSCSVGGEELVQGAEVRDSVRTPDFALNSASVV